MTAVRKSQVQQDWLFGVTNSALGRRWRLVSAPEDRIAALKDDLHIDHTLAYLLAARGYTPETGKIFLEPRLRDQMPDPLIFKDMGVAVDRLERAAKTGELIGGIVDYDVDGQTAAAIFARYCRLLSKYAPQYDMRFRYTSPDRLEEGYGPNVEIVRQLKEDGAQLLLTADCGVVAHSSIDEAIRLGIDTIVTDHHMQSGDLPKALAVINPNRLDEIDNPHKYLCGAALVFMLVVALNRKLGNPVPSSEMLALTDLVALATVADVVPLVGLNRAFVTTGLRQMQLRQNAGLTALCDVASLTETVSVRDLGFALGPRVNASGRIGDYTLGTKLLACDNPDDAILLAQELDRYNTMRKDMQAKIFDAALPEARMQAEQGAKCIIVAHEDWHPGVIGIVAGKIKEELELPAFVIGSYKGRWTGSGRSIPGVNLGHHIHHAVDAGLLVKGGGHAMAGGLTIDPARLDDFRTYMDTEVGRDILLAGGRPPYDVHALVSLGALTPDFVGNLDRLAPFGQGNVSPRLALNAVSVIGVRLIGKNSDTITCELVDEGRNRIKALAFGAASQPHGQALIEANRTQSLLHVVGDAKLDTYAGRTKATLYVSDVAWPDERSVAPAKPHIRLKPSA